MILIADSGSTKTSWRIIVSNNETIATETIGMNPYFIKSDDIKTLLNNDLILKSNKSNIKAIYFYGAGCGIIEKTLIIKSELEDFFLNAKCNIYPDILGAAISLFHNQEGIACILGTGSNTCYYNGKKIEKTLPSSGYIFGDLGSGSHMGKLLLEKYLNNKMPSEIKTIFDDYNKITRTELLTNIYNKPFPNRYLASFCPFIKLNISNEFFKNIVYDCFNEYFIQNIINMTKNNSQSIGIVGSIAYNFKEEIITISKKHNIKIKKILKEPIDELIINHLNKKLCKN